MLFPLIDIFVEHQIYPYQVALQQSLVPFLFDKTNILKISINHKNELKIEPKKCPLGRKNKKIA